MRFGFVADVHVGNHQRHGGPVAAGLNTRCRLVLDALRRAVVAAEEADVTAFVSAGDLVDSPHPPPQLLAALQQVFAPASFSTHLLCGNHEMVSTYPGDHSLAPLGVEGVSVVERPAILRRGRGVEVFLVPFVPGKAGDEIAAACDRLASAATGGGPRALVIHAGVRDEETAPWLREASDAIDVDALMRLSELHNFELVVAGNWHDRRVWRHGPTTIVQVGALVPTGWDNPGLDGYGGLLLWAPEQGVQFVEIPGPRFVKASNAAEAAKLLAIAKKRECHLFAEVSAEPQALAATRSELADLASDVDGCALFDVVPDTSLAKAEAKRAGDAARSAASLDAALDGFVKRMPLPDGVSDRDVLDRVRDYLRQGAP